MSQSCFVSIGTTSTEMFLCSVQEPVFKLNIFIYTFCFDAILYICHLIDCI